MRIKRLDILRCAGCFAGDCRPCWGFLHTLKGRVGRGGSFFVLSGFLISGLLYSEYKKQRAISLRRFFIRRGMKIYPAFYTLLLATFIGQLLFWHAHPQPFSSYLREILFVQNYHFAIWTHTWSLAVEEHFYIGLGILLLFLARSSLDRADPFRTIPQIFVFVALFCLTLRILTIVLIPPAKFITPYVMNLTHTRIDGLFFGVFLGYLYHFRPEAIRNICRPAASKLIIAVLSAALLSCCYFFSRDDHFLLTFGLTFLYLGFGGVLLLCLEVRTCSGGGWPASRRRSGLVARMWGLTLTPSIYGMFHSW
jgi:peptidoglycan/LPS O-acetylase OafA/YrhL